MKGLYSIPFEDRFRTLSSYAYRLVDLSLIDFSRNDIGIPNGQLHKHSHENQGRWDKDCRKERI